MKLYLDDYQEWKRSKETVKDATMPPSPEECVGDKTTKTTTHARKTKNTTEGKTKKTTANDTTHVPRNTWANVVTKGIQKRAQNHRNNLDTLK